MRDDGRARAGGPGGARLRGEPAGHPRGRGLRRRPTARCSPGSTTPRTFPATGSRSPSPPRATASASRSVFDSPRRGPSSASASEPSDLSLGGRRARARQGARRRRSATPSSARFPKPARRAADARRLPRPRAAGYRRRAAGGGGLEGACTGGAAGASWRPRGSPSWPASEAALRRLGLILGGDVTILQERIAIASTAHARAASRRVHPDDGLRHGHGRGARRQGLRVVRRARGSMHFTDEAGERSRRQRDRRHRRRARGARATTRSSSAGSRWPIS